MVSIINLLINLFDTIKVKALECVSVVNKKCMARSKIIDTNAINVAVVVTLLMIQWQNYACLILLKT